MDAVRQHRGTVRQVAIPHLARRSGAFAVGCLSLGTGVSVLLASGLGVAPFDAVNQGLAGKLGVAVGTASWIVAAAAVVLSLLLGHRPGWGTLVTAAAVGMVINLVLPRLPHPDGVLTQVPYSSAGFAMLVTGIALVISANFGAGAIDLLMLALADPRRGLPHLGLRKARWALEAFLLLLAVLLGGDIGAFTVVIVVATGPALAWLLPRLDRWVRPA